MRLAAVIVCLNLLFGLAEAAAFETMVEMKRRGERKTAPVTLPNIQTGALAGIRGPRP